MPTLSFASTMWSVQQKMIFIVRTHGRKHFKACGTSSTQLDSPFLVFQVAHSTCYRFGINFQSREPKGDVKNTTDYESAPTTVLSSDDKMTLTVENNVPGHKSG